ncbi:MAG: hypothetical protein IJ305_07180 [Oscillospiraceae bacterium]|nr:hypothetical protein [Oscillospiraceae bacterium]
MFCQFCGKEIAEGEVCGCANEREVLNEVAENKNNGSGTFITVALIALGTVITLIVLLIVSVGGNYKKPVNQLVKAFNECDGEVLVEATCTKKMLRYYDKKKNWEYEDVCDEFEDMIDDAIDDWEDDFGDDVVLSVEFGDKYELDEDEIEEIEDDYKNNGYRVKIDKAYELECNIAFVGEDDKDDEDYDLIVIKVEGEGWKLHMGSLYEVV